MCGLPHRLPVQSINSGNSLFSPVFVTGTCHVTVFCDITELKCMLNITVT